MTIIIIIIAAIIIWWLVYDFIKKVYMRNRPEKYYGGPAYEVELNSITPDIIVCSNLSKDENVRTAYKKRVTTIIVQETSNSNYYREIISGKLIPVAALRLNKYDCVYGWFNKHHLVEIPVKEYYDDVDCSGEFTFYYDLIKITGRKKVSSEQLQKYISERSGEYEGFNSFAEYLNSIFENAEKYYENSAKNADITDEQKVKNIMADLNNKN